METKLFILNVQLIARARPISQASTDNSNHISQNDQSPDCLMKTQLQTYFYTCCTGKPYNSLQFN